MRRRQSGRSESGRARLFSSLGRKTAFGSPFRTVIYAVCRRLGVVKHVPVNLL